MQKNKDQENIKEITLLKDIEAILTKINEKLLKNRNLIKQKSERFFKK